MLYVCIPAHNEAPTVGVLLWRLRAVLADAGRDYEVVVFDDASTDATAEVLGPYARVLPLTVLRGGPAPVGRSGAVEALVRHVVGRSTHPRRDLCLLLQADFTERAEGVPALLAPLDDGADLVVGRRPTDPAQPAAERRLRRLGPWVLRPLVRVDGVDDPLAGVRAVRVAVLRDFVRARGERPLVAASGWAGVVELLVGLVPFARRVATVDAPGGANVRTRPSRLDWATELRALARYAWGARGARVRAGSARADGREDDRPRAEGPRAEGPRAEGPRAEAPRAERPRRAPRLGAAGGDPERGRVGSTGAQVETAVAPPVGAAAEAAAAPGTGRTRRRTRRKSRGVDVPPGHEPALAAVPDTGDLADARAADPPGPEAAAAAGRRRKKRRRRGARPASAGAGDAVAADTVAPADDPPPPASPAAPADAVAADGAPAVARRRKRRRSRSGPRESGVPSSDPAVDARPGPGDAPADRSPLPA